MTEGRDGRSAPCLMVQGTGSGVGKSVLTAALCRIFARSGYHVAPFKSQNMSLNAAVTRDGLEIGRAQHAQAEAAGVEATVDMNPILLKPESDASCQVVVAGRAVATVDFREYGEMLPDLLPVVEASLRRLRRSHDLVIIEGAGSPAEINMRDREIVNMRIARLADAGVLLVGDVDRGGVFASLVGTLALLPPADRSRVGGFVINKLRGDAGLLASGFDELTARTGVRVLGVVPHLGGSPIAAEDSLDLEREPAAGEAHRLDIAVVRVPRIANFDDFEPLADEPGVRVRFIRAPAELDSTDAVIVPGSKSTVADLGWLRERGVAEAIVVAARAGRLVVGICGGFQMLGRAVHDPDGVESDVRAAAGLGLLDVVTSFVERKTTVRVRGRVLESPGPFGRARDTEVAAYEIHAGRSEVRSGSRPFRIVERGGTAVDEEEGAVNPAGNVVGTYLHGLFANDRVRGAFLRYLARQRGVRPDPRWGEPPVRADRYDRLADVVERAVDIPAVAKLAGLEFPRP